MSAVLGHFFGTCQYYCCLNCINSRNMLIKNNASGLYEYKFVHSTIFLGGDLRDMCYSRNLLKILDRKWNCNETIMFWRFMLSKRHVWWEPFSSSRKVLHDFAVSWKNRHIRTSCLSDVCFLFLKLIWGILQFIYP